MFNIPLTDEPGGAASQAANAGPNLDEQILAQVMQQSRAEADPMMLMMQQMADA